MRDHLCIEEKCREGIEFNKEFIDENIEDIKSFEEDIKNGIQRKPNDNKSIIEARYLRNFIYETENIIAKYSLGENIDTVEADFENAINYLEHVGERKVGYLSLLWTLSLGILLETDKKNIERISKVVEKKEINDSVVDFLLCASDIGYAKITNEYDKEIPYAKTREIIELAETDKKAASKRLQTYMEKDWFQGHYDYEWKNAHKEHGYIGYWSFETAAIAKILKLDDTSLMHNNHYPYDLAHYKNSMTFKSFSFSDYIQEEPEKETEEIIEGIANNPLLEKIIPPKWHAFINELISDYDQMDDNRFYEKYKATIGLGQIWFFLEDYQEENKERNMLGTLIVFAQVVKDSIYQLDYKEDVEDYKAFIKNEWNKENVKLIQFILNNDQQYYAYVPADMSVEQMYEVDILEVKKISMRT